MKTPRPEQLPIWAEPMRGGPNALLRSALFSAIHSKKRKIIGTQTSASKEPEGVMIAAQDGIKIKYAGTQFNQQDADVFFEGVHRSRKDPLETECTFQGSDFLNAIGRTDSKGNYEDLDESLRRLRRGELQAEWTINGRHYVFTGSLIASYVRETTTKLYKITFSKEVSILFAPASWTQLEWEQRKALKGQPLGQWLHSYFSTHAEPFPVSVAYLHEKSGSQRTLLKNFKTDLKKAFEVLHNVLGWEFVWDKNLVTVKRPPSSSQARHIERKHVKTAKLTKERAIAKSRQHANELTSVSDLLPGLLNSIRL
jgi:hypothetical protein